MLDQFKNFLKMKDYSDKYLSIVRCFLNYCNRNKIDCIYLTTAQLESFILDLRNQSKMNGTINNYIKGIRMFYKFLLSHGLSQVQVETLFKDIKTMKVDRKIRSVFTIKELDKMIRDTMTFTSTQPYKIKAMIYFMFYTGVRKKELLNLKRQDIDLDKRTAVIRVPTKNRNERIVMYPDIVVDVMRQYYRIEPVETVNVFNVTEPQFDYIINWMKNFCPQGKIFSAHILRHSFAHLLAANMIDIRVAQKLLGHKNLNSTAIYYDPDIETIKLIYNKKIK